MKNTILLSLISATIFGCASISEERQIVSSGQIGCSPKEITISENEQYTWVAQCKEQAFICSIAPTASCSKKLK